MHPEDDVLTLGFIGIPTIKKHVSLTNHGRHSKSHLEPCVLHADKQEETR